MTARHETCIVGLNYPPEPTGISPYAGGLAVGLAKAGHTVTAHVAHPHYPEWKIHAGFGQWTRHESSEGVDVVRRLHYVPRTPRGVRRLASELTYGLRLLVGRWGRPKVVIAISPPLFSTALVVARARLTRKRPTVIVWVQDIYSLGLSETGEGSNLTLRFTKWVERYVLSSADRVVVIHERFADFMERDFCVSPSRVSVIRNWTHLPETAPVNRDEAKAKLKWPREVSLAVHTGNMGAKQGLSNIVEAAKLADAMEAPVHFILVGDGGERRTLQELAIGASRLTFVDPLDAEAYRLALGAADVLLVNEMPGVSAMAMPSKLTSYFDAGRPVVAATDPHGITASEIKTSGAGVVVPAGDPSALLNAILDMREHSDRAAEYAENGRAHRHAVLSKQAAINQWLQIVGALVGDD